MHRTLILALALIPAAPALGQSCAGGACARPATSYPAVHRPVATYYATPAGTYAPAPPAHRVAGPGPVPMPAYRQQAARRWRWRLVGR